MSALRTSINEILSNAHAHRFDYAAIRLAEICNVRVASVDDRALHALGDPIGGVSAWRALSNGSIGYFAPHPTGPKMIQVAPSWTHANMYDNAYRALLRGLRSLEAYDLASDAENTG